MPKLVEIPNGLRPYTTHGVDVQHREGEPEAVAECPWCGKSKLHIAAETGLYHCKTCGEQGNPLTFVRKVWKESKGPKELTDWTPLLEDRRLLTETTLIRWGMVWSHLSGDRLLPGYAATGEVSQVYRWVPLGGKHRLLATPTLPHGIHGANFDKSAETIYLCEGPWDGMCLYEVMYSSKRTSDGKLASTSNPQGSLLATANVLAVPGANVFQESWRPLFAGKDVVILFDSDHPGKNPKTGAPIEPVGYAGTKRVVSILTSGKNPPKSVSYLKWGEDGYDPNLPHGYDVRDYLTATEDSYTGYEQLASKSPRTSVKPTSVDLTDSNSIVAALASRRKRLESLLDLVAPCPSEWLSGPRKGRSKGSVGEPSQAESSVACIPCDSYETLIESWRAALQWYDGLDRALSCMLATVISTMSVGDQLWFKIVGPAATGKSTLCEALSVNRDYVMAKSTIRGFHSGFGNGDEDNSLVGCISGKTLVTKDGDTLLQSPNLEQILAEARDIYDRTSRAHYRNKTSRDYEGINMTWLLCGTSSLRSIDQSELGERFLDCVIMERIEESMEEQVLWRVAQRAHKETGVQVNGKPESNYGEELAKAMGLTGGYVGYLRENAQSLLQSVMCDEPSMRKCISYGKYVAHMRARPSLNQEELAEREFASRLVSQMVRLAKCTAAVLGRKSIAANDGEVGDGEVMRRVRQVALDTARGPVMDLVRYIHGAGERGYEAPGIALHIGIDGRKIGTLLRFLQRIEVLEARREVKAGVKLGVKWKLTERMRKLHEQVMG